MSDEIRFESLLFEAKALAIHGADDAVERAKVLVSIAREMRKAGLHEKAEVVDLWLVDHGPRRGDTIKVIREVTGLCLADAADLANLGLVRILRGVHRDYAEGAKHQFEKAGAIIAIRDPLPSEPAS